MQYHFSKIEQFFVCLYFAICLLSGEFSALKTLRAGVLMNESLGSSQSAAASMGSTILS
jgi:hypothetical protein